LYCVPGNQFPGSRTAQEEDVGEDEKRRDLREMDSTEEKRAEFLPGFSRYTKQKVPGKINDA